MINFGEKQNEYSPKHGKEIPVWQSPKYVESRAKAEEIINSQKYGVLASDFWILMNVTKSEKMAYTGLIISHNGCLKINDCLESKFDPACVQLDKDGYKGSLVYTYCNPAQGIYEVGEVSPANCKNEYPYAMAYKRLFDRVVLKLSKLAYVGIYSDSEADEFAQQVDAPEKNAAPEQKPAIPQSNQQGKKKATAPAAITCERCKEQVKPSKKRDGTVWEVQDMVAYSMKRFKGVYCQDCMKAAHDAEKLAAAQQAGAEQ